MTAPPPLSLHMNSNGESGSSPLKSPSKCGVKCFCDAKMSGKFPGHLCCGNRVDETQINNVQPTGLIDIVQSDHVQMDLDGAGSLETDESSPVGEQMDGVVEEMDDEAGETIDDEFDICPISPLRNEAESSETCDSDSQTKLVGEHCTEPAVKNEKPEHTDDTGNDSNKVNEEESDNKGHESSVEVEKGSEKREDVSQNSAEDNEKTSQMESFGLISTKKAQQKITEKSSNTIGSQAFSIARMLAEEAAKDKSEDTELEFDADGQVVPKKEPKDVDEVYGQADFETLREGGVDDDMAKIEEFEICEEGPQRKRARRNNLVTANQLIVFEKGWKRELVFRGTCEKDGRVTPKRAGDVYYWPPVGRKLRSMPEIEAYLELHPDPDITMGCFTFNKNPIHKPPFEIIREAGKTKRSSFKASASPSKPAAAKRITKAAQRTAPLIKVTPPVVKPTAVTVATPPPQNSPQTTACSPAELPGFGPASARKKFGPGGPKAKKRKFKAAPDSLQKIQLMQAVESTVANIASAKKAQKVTYSVDPPVQICSLKCPGLEGVHPTLHCGLCMCLFHHKCVNFVSSEKPDIFICLRCVKLGGIASKEVAETSAREPSDLKITDVVSHADMNGREALSRPDPTLIPKPMPPLHKAPTSSPSPAASPLLHGLTRTPPALTGPGQQQHQHQLSQQLQHKPPPLHHHSVLRTLMSNKPSVMGLQQPPPVPPVPPPPPLVSAKSKPIFIGGPLPQPTMVTNSSPGNTQYQVSSAPPGLKGQLLALPPNVLTKLNLQQPLALRINNQQLVIQPSSFVFTPQGLRILLPEGTLKESSKDTEVQKPLQVAPALPPASSISVGPPPLHMAPTPASAEETGVSGASGVPVMAKPSVQKEGRQLRPRVKKINVCHFKMLHVGFDCLLEIFKCLTIRDRLRASCVCRTWRNVAIHNSLCKSISLQDSRVSNWPAACTYFTKYGTRSLDLRGLQHDGSNTWTQLTSALSQLVTVQHLHMGQCPASVLQAVTEKMPQLVSLVSEWTTDSSSSQDMWTANAKIDLGKMSRLEHLEELKLRGVCGIVLPQISLSGGICGLSGLTGLKKLSLTTLTNVQSEDLTFLAQLQGLHQLELGDCLNWSEEAFGFLAVLTELRHLRLECGGELPDLGLAKALKNMVRLKELELIMYRLDEGILKVVAALTSLRVFSVWPDTREKGGRMNHAIFQHVKTMKFLRQFDWGVMPSEDIDEMESSQTMSKVAFIPFCFEKPLFKEVECHSDRSAAEHSKCDTNGDLPHGKTNNAFQTKEGLHNSVVLSHEESRSENGQVSKEERPGDPADVEMVDVLEATSEAKLGFSERVAVDSVEGATQKPECPSTMAKVNLSSGNVCEIQSQLSNESALPACERGEASLPSLEEVQNGNGESLPLSHEKTESVLVSNENTEILLVANEKPKSVSVTSEKAESLSVSSDKAETFSEANENTESLSGTSGQVKALSGSNEKTESLSVTTEDTKPLSGNNEKTGALAVTNENAETLKFDETADSLVTKMETESAMTNENAESLAVTNEKTEPIVTDERTKWLGAQDETQLPATTEHFQVPLNDKLETPVNEEKDVSAQNEKEYPATDEKVEKTESHSGFSEKASDAADSHLENKRSEASLPFVKKKTVVVVYDTVNESWSMDTLGDRLCAALPTVKIRVYRIPIIVNDKRSTT